MAAPVSIDVRSDFPILAGDIDIVHFEIDSDAVSLKKALSMPCTQMSHLSIKKGKAADFLKAYYESFDKYVVGENYHGMWMRYPYEDPYFPVFLIAIDFVDSPSMPSWDGKMSKIITMS